MGVRTGTDSQAGTQPWSGTQESIQASHLLNNIKKMVQWSVHKIQLDL